MPAPLDTEVEGRIKQLLDCNYKIKWIERRLNELGYPVSYNTIQMVKYGIGKARESRNKGKDFKPAVNRRKVTPRVLKLIDLFSSGPNPKSQSWIAYKFNLSLGHVNTIIHKVLKKKTRVKPRGCYLTDEDKRRRKKNARKLLPYLTRAKKEFAVSLDESMMCFYEGEQETSICSMKKEEEMSEEYVRVINQSLQVLDCYKKFRCINSLPKGSNV